MRSGSYKWPIRLLCIKPDPIRRKNYEMTRLNVASHYLANYFELFDFQVVVWNQWWLLWARVTSSFEGVANYSKTLDWKAISVIDVHYTTLVLSRGWPTPQEFSAAAQNQKVTYNLSNLRNLSTSFTAIIIMEKKVGVPRQFLSPEKIKCRHFEKKWWYALEVYWLY